ASYTLRSRSPTRAYTRGRACVGRGPVVKTGGKLRSGTPCRGRERSQAAERPDEHPREEGMTEYRTEKDSMGELAVPASALWGAQTQRAVQNFPISGLPMPGRFIHSLGLIKWAAARVNRELGLLPADVADA